jgi:hypothetical protein
VIPITDVASIIKNVIYINSATPVSAVLYIKFVLINLFLVQGSMLNKVNKSSMMITDSKWIIINFLLLECKCKCTEFSYPIY